MRLIDADELLEYMQKAILFEDLKDAEKVRNCINDIPPIDVIECQSCVFWKPLDKSRDLGRCQRYTREIITCRGEYCSAAKRRLMTWQIAYTEEGKTDGSNAESTSN